MYFFMFDDNGDVNCSCVTTESNMVEGAIAITKEMYESPDHSIYYKVAGEIQVRAPRPSDNHAWLMVDETYQWVPVLTKLQAAKSADILMECQKAIVSGFESNALGAAYHYPSKVLDQQNLAASVLASYDPENPSGWLTPFWCADEAGEWEFRPHTAAQIRQVGRDAKSAVLGFQFHNEQLQAQILAANTQEAVEAITWSN